MYISVKRIGKNKRPYAYLQHSVRIGKRVRTHSKYLGPAGSVNMGGHIIAKLLTDPKAREEFFKTFEERMAEKDARDAARVAEANVPTIIGDLTVAKEWTPEMFDREGMSQKSDAFSVAANPSSSDADMQLSDQATATSQAESNPAPQDSQ